MAWYAFGVCHNALPTVDNPAPHPTPRACDTRLFRPGRCQTLYITPGSPWENPFIESFNGHFRTECLDRCLFANGREAQVIIEGWRLDYNRERPHSSLGYLTPAEFAQTAYISLKQAV
jgi:putative transposase